MKILLLLFLVGYASASFYDVLEEAAEEYYNDFVQGMEEASSLKEALGLEEDHFFADDVEDEVKSELRQHMRDALNRILENVKEALENGKTVREDLQVRLHELREKMRELGIDMGAKAKHLLGEIREKAKEFFKVILEKLQLNEKGSVQDEELEIAFADFNFKDMLQKLKKKALGTIDKKALKQSVEDIFGKGNELADQLLETINKAGDKYKQVLLDWIEKHLGDKKHLPPAVKDYWEKVKEYFKDLHIDLQEKYGKFGQWVKEVAEKGLSKGKDRMANIKEIAREFVEHAKGVSREVAIEGLNFLKPYQEDLGSLYDQVKETVKDILKREE